MLELQEARRNGGISEVSNPHTCTDCGRRISPYSRGRCEGCAYEFMKRPMPDDFMEILKKHGSAGAAKHYRASLSTVTRWRRDSGISKHERAKPARYCGGKFNFSERPLIVHRDMAQAGQAADFLRKFAAVYRCDESGRVPKRGQGKFWNRNGYVLTDEELIAKARRMGWAPIQF